MVSNTFEHHHFDSNIVVLPVISIEPRYYYNLKKRQAKGKIIDGNSGNYFSIKAVYAPVGLAILKDDTLNKSKANSCAIIPNWGIRRNINHSFNYEAGIGIGYRQYVSERSFENFGDIFPYFHIRIGYRF